MHALPENLHTSAPRSEFFLCCFTLLKYLNKF